MSSVSSLAAGGASVSALVYIILTALLGRHLLARLSTTIANDLGDPLLTGAILHWNAYTVPLSAAWWQFPIYYPTRDALAFSEHLLGLSVIASPIAWVTRDPLVTYNLTLLLTFPLSALAMYALVFRLTRQPVAAFLAGLAFGFAPYRMSNLPHIQALASFWAPLALLGLHAYLENGRKRWLVLYGGAWALQAAANLYSLIFFSLLIGLWVLWFVVARQRWRELGAIALATVVAFLPLAPIAAAYVSVHATHGFERSLGETRDYSADVAAVLCAPDSLTFWGWLRVACRAEGELFPGVALFALCAAAAVLTIRRGPPAGRITRIVSGLLLSGAVLFGLVVAGLVIAGPWQLEFAFVRLSASDVDKPLLVALAFGVAALLVALGRHLAPSAKTSTLAFYLCAAVAAWLLALGPTITLMGEHSGRPGPFALLQWMPGVSGVRVPARFWLVALICLTAAAGLFVGELLRGRRRGTQAAAGLVAGLALLSDGWIASIPTPPAPAPVPNAAVLRGGLVLQLPLDLFSDVASTWRAVTGGWRAVNGYSGYAPNYYNALTLAANARDDEVFEPFRHRGDLHVIVPDDAVDAAALHAFVERQPGVELIGRRAGMSQYHLPAMAAPAAVKAGTPLKLSSATSECDEARPSVAIDQDLSTLWSCGRQDHQSLIIDLGELQHVDALVYELGSYQGPPALSLTIETSDDGVVWNTAHGGSIVNELIEGGIASPAALRATITFAPREARFVRVRPRDAPADFVWRVADFDVLGTR